MKNFNSGRVVNVGYYAAFMPELIDRVWEMDNMAIITLLTEADRELGRLDMYSHYVNIEHYISMHLAKEATLSSRIEGTQTHIEEVFMDEAVIAHEKRNDWQEVQNYITAMKITMAQLQDLPFSSRLIRNGHAKILSGVRGSDKQPGEFRRSQNWIGGATLKDAVFVPPPHTEIGHLMSDLEHFANNEKYPIPELLKVAILHYQFETIHPFLDGNGRVGRMLIPLYLMSKGVLKQPVLYLSGFFEKHRSLYYDNLTRVRTHHDLAQWLKFFLAGIIETSKHGVKTLDSILRLQKEVDIKLSPLGSRAINARKVMGHLFRSPIVDVQQVAAIIGKSNVSAYKLIADMERLNILEEMTGGQRGRLYRFKEYLDLFNS